MNISMGKLIGLIKGIAGQGAGGVKPVVILPETVLTWNDEYKSYEYTNPLKTFPEAGKSYTVTYNGVGYDCTAIANAIPNGPTFIMMGNTSLMGVDGGDSNIPFVVSCYPDEMASESGLYLDFILAPDGKPVQDGSGTSVTLSIVEKATESADDGGWDVMLHIDGMSGNISEITDATKISFEKGSFDELVDMLIAGVVPRVCAYCTSNRCDGAPEFSMWSPIGVIMYSLSNGHNVKLYFVDAMGKRTSVTVTQYGFKISTVA